MSTISFGKKQAQPELLSVVYLVFGVYEQEEGDIKEFRAAFDSKELADKYTRENKADHSYQLIEKHPLNRSF